VADLVVRETSQRRRERPRTVRMSVPAAMRTCGHTHTHTPCQECPSDTKKLKKRKRKNR
jgi:hypothetical protein